MRWLALWLWLAPGCSYAMQHAYRVATPTSDTTTTVAEARRVRHAESTAPSFWFESGEEGTSTGESGLAGLALGVAGPQRQIAYTGDAADASGGGGSAAPPQEAHEQYAQAQTSLTPPEPEATDAVDTSGELLVYTALFHVGVYDVEASEAAIAEHARSLGGFVFAQGDDSIVVRVPAARFAAFMGQIDSGYDVLHREVQAQDVGDEFRDVEVRIRNLQAERDGIAALLERGLSVEQVLVVERELERVTSELEQMRARQRFLADRISLSTITVMFRPLPHDAIDQPAVFQLPFAWLESLGLPNLLELR